MSMYAKVRRMHLREKVSINEIARRTSLSRNTIRKWLKEPERSELKYARPPGSTKLDQYVDEVRQALETDAHRPRRDRRTLLRLFAQIKTKGYDGGYSQLTERIRRWRAEAGSVTARSAYVPLRFEWGEAAYPGPFTPLAQRFPLAFNSAAILRCSAGDISATARMMSANASLSASR